MSFETSTIIALATAYQSAGVGILRLSGPASLSVLKTLFRTLSGAPLTSIQERHAYFGKIFSALGDFLDDAIALYFKAPHSFTGEDILEFHCHGNLLLLREILQTILGLKDLGLRYAEAGEFSRRAFLNHKMDLTEVEALQGLIMADSLASLKSHRFNLSGRLSAKVNELKERLMLSLALVEASFEFPDEDIQTYNPRAVFDELKEIKASLLELVQSYSNCKVFDQGIKVALLGEPNVGKSSLLNALLQEDRAIVSPLAGTTRDVIYGARQIMDLKFHFSDTAGLRQTHDEIESLGIERSHIEAKRADIVLYLTDNPKFRERPLFSSAKHYYILTKSDLLDRESLEINKPFFDFTLTVLDFEVVDNIMKKICTDFNPQSVQIRFHVNARQNEKISSSLESVQNLIENWSNLSSTELLSEELRFIIRNLEEITGLVTSEDVLGEIFKRFCIGK